MDINECLEEVARLREIESRLPEPGPDTRIMKISELIAELEATKGRSGDLPVAVWSELLVDEQVPKAARYTIVDDQIAMFLMNR